MKFYRIVKRDGVWHALSNEPVHPVAAGDNKNTLIQLARQLAARHDGEVRVCDAAGNLEVIYAYSAGNETVRKSPSQLRLVGGADFAPTSDEMSR